jgi:uncharacterized protein
MTSLAIETGAQAPLPAPRSAGNLARGPRIGLGYRQELGSWTLSRTDVECLEITAEHFFEGPLDHLQELRQRFPLFVHGLGLSLGTPGPLDPSTLRAFQRVVEAADPEWISEHISFTRSGDLDLGHLNPVPRTREMAAILADHARELAEACGKPLILENITTHLDPGGDMVEADFLNLICERGDCGLLLDVTNLLINARNFGYDPVEWLSRVDAMRIRQLHIVGYSFRDGRYQDSHSAPIQDELFDLLDEVLRRAQVEAVLLERDERFEALNEIESELARLKERVSGGTVRVG